MKIGTNNTVKPDMQKIAQMKHQEEAVKNAPLKEHKQNLKVPDKNLTNTHGLARGVV